MPTASSPTGYTDVIAHAINARFNTRPTLRSVTASRLKDDVLEHYPALDFDPYRTQIAQALPEGGWRFTLLLDQVLAYLASGTPPQLREQFGRRCFLTNNAPVPLTFDNTTPREPDLQVIADVIRGLPGSVSVAFQEALARYWNEGADAGGSRWQWLGDLLGGVLKTSAVRQSASHPLHAEILSELGRHPDHQQRLEAPWAKGVIQACVLETTLTIGAQSFSVQSPDILVICGETVLLCSVSGTVESFPSLDSFGQAWGARFEQAYMADSITWKRFVPHGNIFDTQAALLLNQQLDNLAALKLPAGQRLDVLEKRYEAITDVAALFIGHQPSDPATLPRLKSTLPHWLQRADATDRMAYRKHVLALSGIKQQTAGRTFLDGIDNLHAFAKKALRKQMLADQPLAPGYDPDQLELTFHVPVGDLGSGYLEPIKMTLTELAIKNLASKPKGRMTLRHTTGQLIQDWTTDAYLLDLVSRVNVGQHYPELIRTELLADTTQARERGRLFGLELSVQLPLLALEQAIKAEHGFTRQGYRCVAALMHSTRAERFVDEQEMVIRPLAFQRKTGADCDVASNMFIIEPRDVQADGPRILYRPMYVPALQQYPDRQALLNAIAQPGPLQSSVLTWLADRAQPIYANNGFHEPHIVHLHLGDEYSPPSQPAPALLAGDEAASDWLAALEKGQLLARLFDSNARTLVELADRQSVSNLESCWAIILEGSWLVFNNLVLPLLRGPAMLMGWMLQLTHSLLQDLPALDSQDVTAREQAWVDVLLNLGLVLLHVAQIPGAIDGQQVKAPTLSLEPLRRPRPHLHTPADMAVTQAPPGLPAEPPGSGHTLLDFNLSTARDSTSARLFAKLHAVRVPWPASLPQPAAIGPFQGLYRIDGHWHATLAGLLFRVQIVPGLGEVFIVHPEHPDHPGIKLKTDGHGKWSLDQGLKLVGGGPKKRIAAMREERQQRIAELDLQDDEFQEQQERIQKRVDIAENVMVLKDKASSSTEPDRALFRQRFVVELDKQTETYVTLIAGMKEKSALTDTPVDHQRLAVLLENIINNVRKRLVIADVERSSLMVRYAEYQSGMEHLFDAMQIEGDVAVTNRYMEFLRQTSDVNEVMIQCFEEIDARLQQLREIPLLGPRAIKRLTSDRPERELTTLRLKSYQLVILKILSVKSLGTDALHTLESVIDPLLLLSRTHAELQTGHVYESNDRLVMLDNLATRYNKAQDALGSIGIFFADELQMPVFNRLRVIIDQLQTDAEQRLAQELQRSEQVQPWAPLPGASKQAGASKKLPKSPPATGARKKVIKTSKGTFIGDIRPRIAEQGGDIVDINGPMEDKPLASFHEHAPDVWVEIVEARPPAPKAATTPYPLLKGEARKALAKVDGQVQKIGGYVQRASSPKEIEEQLQREARKLTRYADDLEQHPSPPQANERDNALITGLRDKAVALEHTATQLRIRMTLEQAPTNEGVQYLLQHNRLSVSPVGRRVQLKTGRRDFMQDYVLLNADNEPWWYAHFHYAQMADAKADYTTAHLKTREQHFETYESAQAKAQDSKQQIEIYRAAISKALAEQYFLPLEPR